MRRIWLTAVLSISCGGGGTEGVDAGPDSPPVAVVALPSCPDTVTATVIDSPSTFVPPMTTIAVGDVVKFDINPEHFVIPHASRPSDPALMVARGETKCFRFDTSGTYNFVCGVHGFAGSIEVQ